MERNPLGMCSGQRGGYMEAQGTTARRAMDGGTQLIPSLGQHPAFIFPEFDMLLLYKSKLHIPYGKIWKSEKWRGKSIPYSFYIKKTIINRLSYFFLGFFRQGS